MTTLPRVRDDATPQGDEYRDTGCDASPSCLSCPFVMCRYDYPGGVRSLISLTRDVRVVEDYDSGMRVDDIAAKHGVARRTVFRVLRERRR